MRLFLALDIADSVRARVAALLDSLRAVEQGVKWVPPESLHLTLKFIGEWPEVRFDELTAALERAPKTGALELRFHGFGCFPNERSPRVFWVGVDAPPGVSELAAGIEDALETLGIAREQ